jgi:hypothetical protein
MIQTKSQPVSFYAFFVESKVGKTGLIVTADIYRGTSLISSDVSAVEVGGGLYRYVLSGASTATAEVYAAVFKTTDTTVDAKQIPSLWQVGPAWAESAAIGAGEGDTAVDHDTGGTDSLRYLHNGLGVDDATIRAYLKADYDAGVYTERGRSHTKSDGRWAQPMYLDSGLTYTITFAKPGVFEVSKVEVEV